MKRSILYLDESGSGNLADNSQNLLITGLLIAEDADQEISAYFNYIKRIYKIPENTPFHSYDLFENVKSHSYLSHKKAHKLVESLIEFIKIIPMRGTIHYVDKKRLRSFFGMKEGQRTYFTGSEEAQRWKDIPYELLSSKIFLWFANSIRDDRKSRGAIVAESRRESDHALLRSYLRCKTPSQFHSSNMKSCSERMQKQVSSIRFGEKTGLWPGLEIADLFSYVAYQAVNRKIRQKYFRERNFTRLWGAMKNKIDSRKINEANSHTFKTYISSNRVHKISNKVRIVNKSEVV